MDGNLRSRDGLMLGIQSAVQHANMLQSPPISQRSTLHWCSFGEAPLPSQKRGLRPNAPAYCSRELDRSHPLPGRVRDLATTSISTIDTQISEYDTQSILQCLAVSLSSIRLSGI